MSRYVSLVAPPPPLPVSSTEQNKAKMNVKRINWEKLDQQRVENTIWEQVGLKHFFVSVYR